MRRRRIVKLLFLVSLRTKGIIVTSVEPLMSHGLSFRCPYYVFGPGTFKLCCCLWRIRERSDLIKNSLICVPKMNIGLAGLKTT